MEGSASPIIVTLSWDREQGRPLPTPASAQLPVTEGLARLFARAQFVNRTDATPLSFTSLLVAMITGGDAVSAELRRELDVFEATARLIAGRRSRALDESAMASLPAVDGGTPLAMSQSARQALEQARIIATDVASGPLDVRHLAAAYPILQGWHEQDFVELGIDRLAWARALGGYMAAAFPAEKRYWRRYADRASPVPVTSFSADVYTERDLLGIDRTVDALALLVASTRTDTPLSIGVFGQWGSGKSFFMRHLRRRIWTIAEREDRRVSEWTRKRDEGTAGPDDAPLYYHRVAQVEFNAWHYNEGNLVASLVDHLFRNLRVFPDDEAADLERQREEVLVRISGIQDEIDGATGLIGRTRREVDEAENAVQASTRLVEEARGEIEALTREAARENEAAAQAQARMDTLLRELSTEGGVDGRAALDVLLAPLTESAAVAEARDWRDFLGDLLTPRGLVVIALCLAAPALALLSDWLNDVWAAAGAVATTLAAATTQVRAVLKERRARFEEKLSELEAAEEARRARQRQELLDRHAQVEAEWQRRVETLRQELARQRVVLEERSEASRAAVSSLLETTRRLDEHVEERARAEGRLAELQSRLKRLSSALLLDEFIKERSENDEYRKQLGFLALVRRDFERLSNLLAAANAEWADAGKRTPPPLINRIVLYVDDLDRCKADTVIQVLEAVHLLLAFPIFVCVVAVDPRWIEDCLRERRSSLFGRPAEAGAGAVVGREVVGREAGAGEAGAGDALGDTAHVTAGDYLEKIFQIPIWMAPIESDQRAEVVRTLLGATASPVREVSTRGTGARTEAPLPPTTTPGDEGRGGFTAALSRAEETPDPLRITPEESSYVDRVAPLLSEKPRALKRFVNTYRLLKASLPDLDRAGFVTDDPSSPYRVCMSQLAFFTGRPRLAPVLTRCLERGGDAESLGAWLEEPSADRCADLRTALADMPDLHEISLEAYRAWLPQTSRYLFHREVR